MPAPTPNITINVDLLDYSGAKQGTANQPAWVRVALCNYGPYIPAVNGAGLVTKVTSWFLDLPYTGSTLTFKLWGNDQITPGGTYYTISVLDTQKNVVQTDRYIFTGTQTIDLSGFPPIPPGGAPLGLPNLEYQPCSGAVPGTVYTAPGTVVALFYNGVAMPLGASLPTLSYTLAGGTVATLNFTTQAGDRIDALCIVS